MKGIKMSDCKFYVDEAKRTVVCVVPRTHNMVAQFLHDSCEFNDVWFGGSRLRDKIEMPKSFSGKAVCSPDDEWNEEIGKKLAFKRAKEKVYTSFFKRASTYVNTIDRRLNEMITRFNDFGAKLDENQKKLTDELEFVFTEKE